MCGIAGFCDFTHDNRVPVWGTVAQTMAAQLARRGPDGAGLWQGSSCVFSHRRLAVIDPAGGKQPMSATVQGRECVLCYNGELYNTQELRAELEKRHGGRFAPPEFSADNAAGIAWLAAAAA